MVRRTRARRHFKPRVVEPLEIREMLSGIPTPRVIVADLDTASSTIPDASWMTGYPTHQLGNYLIPGYDFTSGRPVPVAAGSGPYLSHGSFMGAVAAFALESAGDATPEVMTMVCGDATSGFNPVAVGMAMQTVAAWAANDPSTRWVVACPIEGGIASSVEVAGIDALSHAGVPLSVAAGNYSGAAPFGLGSVTASNVLVMGAADVNGVRQSYSSTGPTVELAGLRWWALGTSGASLIGAAWLATQEAAYPLPASPGDRSAYAASLVTAVRAHASPAAGSAGWIADVPTVLPVAPVVPTVTPPVPIYAYGHPHPRHRRWRFR